MLFLCCFTELRDEVKNALLACVWPEDHVRFVYVGHDEVAYARELRAVWESGRSFVSVEHDNIIRPDVVETFHTSPHGWAAYPYQWQTNCGPAMGCTRFTGEFTMRYPDAMRYAMSRPSAWGKPGHWKQVAWYLTDDYLKRRGERPAVYLPRVEHLNPTSGLRPDMAHLSDAEHLALLGLEPAA